MLYNTAQVFAPATVANVGPGFDIFGFAMHEPGDEVVATLSPDSGVRITSITGDGGALPLDSVKNTAAVAVTGLLARIEAKNGITLEIHKKMPLGSGLGSSAASAVAAVVAVNELLGRPLERHELLPFTMEGERIACGAAHADNVAPSLLGGFILIRSYAPLDIVKIPTPEGLTATVVHPHIEVRTEDARRILRRTIPLSSAITQCGNVAGLIAGLLTKNYGLIGRSLTDCIVEPQRTLLIPGFENVKHAALGAGALGCSISGSGPSIFALSSSLETGTAVGRAMRDAFTSVELVSDVFVSPVNKEGPKIIAMG
ncbi:homoserine kinase [Candidatus Uhrbacteria bacterium]|nr:homoserine kinase [Candidatus Uhrbacteria bacterium]